MKTSTALIGVPMKWIAKPMNMEEGFNQVSRRTGCSLKRRAKTISLVLSLAMAYSAAIAQDRLITGTVVSSEDGIGIPGVNVVCKGASVGTATDVQGHYSLMVPPSVENLLFSYIGFKAQEVELAQRSVVDISLQPSVSELSEIVVTGTGVPVEKKKLAFAVETLSSEKFPIVPTASIDQGLIGKIPGAQISSINGTPGSEISILLRGINSLNRGTQPMILLDGAQMGATLLSSIDVNSIERVEVLQGAAASTIYGAQGANGVIQLFSKKGKSGAMKVEFSMSLGTNELLNVGGLKKAELHGFRTNANNEVLKGATQVPVAQDSLTLLYDGIALNLFDTAVNFNKPYDQNLKYVDHFNMFFKPATTTNYRIGLSGGSDKMDYSLTASNTKQESNFVEDGSLDRTNLNMNIGVALTKQLQLRSITQFIYTNNTINIWDKQDYGLNGNFIPLLASRPFADFAKRNVDGDYGAFLGTAAGFPNQFNPFYEFKYAHSYDKKYDIMQNLNLTYTFPRYVSVDFLYGINYQTSNFRHEVQNQSLNRNSNASNYWTYWNNGEDNTGEITVYNNDRSFQNLKTSVSISFDFEKDFKTRIPVRSFTQFTYDYRSDQLGRYESYALGMPLVPPLTSSAGTAFAVPDDYKEEFVTFGYLVNQRFEYKELAGLSGGFRSDFSSAFGKGSKPFTFPRADGFFRVSSLAFWNNSALTKTILEWKLRAAYGEAGIQPRPFDRYVTLGTRALGKTNALYFPPNQNNADLDVEVSKEFETGTDIVVDGFRGNWLRSVQLSASYWTRKTDNAILQVDAPPSQGISKIKDNAVSLKSNGVQVSVLSSIFKNSKWTWNLTANFSKQQSLVAAVKGDTILAGNRIITADQSVGELYGTLMLHSVDQARADGRPFIPPDGSIDPITEKPYASNQTQSAYEVASNGWVVNTSTKQPFLSPDKFSLGNPNPDFMMTFINDFSYKNIVTFSFQLDWLSGNKVYNNTKQALYQDGVHSDYQIPITIDSVSGAWSAFYRGAYTPAGGLQFKNYFYEDASFVRLRNISAGVDFAKLFKIKRIEKLQLIFSGRNLWTYTHYTGMDPEISTYGVAGQFNTGVTGQVNTTLHRGVDDGSRPNLRTYQVTFIIGL